MFLGNNTVELINVHCINKRRNVTINCCYNCKLIIIMLFTFRFETCNLYKCCCIISYRFPWLSPICNFFLLILLTIWTKNVVYTQIRQQLNNKNIQKILVNIQYSTTVSIYMICHMCNLFLCL